MRHFFLIFATLLLTSVPATAQRLWEVSGKDAKGASYLFGTHHVAPADILDRTPGFSDALEAADVVYGELIMTDMNDPSLQQQIVSMSMAPADSTLSRLLTPAQLDSLNTVLKKYSGGMLNASMLETLKPMMVNTQLAMMQSMVAFPDFNPAEQLDAIIQSRAKETGKEIRGFETMEQQMTLLLSDPLTEQATDLMESVAKESLSLDMAHNLAAAYEAADTEAIMKLMYDSETGFNSELADRLIIRRNLAWIETILREIPRERLFVAVGIGHLIGEEGLIESLRRKGYTVKPVN